MIGCLTGERETKERVREKEKDNKVSNRKEDGEREMKNVRMGKKETWRERRERG
jgi:hypothetical protein